MARGQKADRVEWPARRHATWARRQTFDARRLILGCAEDEAPVVSLARLVREELVVERADDRDSAPAGLALRLDVDSILLVVGASTWITLLRGRRLPQRRPINSAAAEAGVEGGRPEGAVASGSAASKARRHG